MNKDTNIVEMLQHTISRLTTLMKESITIWHLRLNCPSQAPAECWSPHKPLEALRAKVSRHHHLSTAKLVRPTFPSLILWSQPSDCLVMMTGVFFHSPDGGVCARTSYESLTGALPERCLETHS